MPGPDDTVDDQGHWLRRLTPLVLAALLGGTGGAGIKEWAIPSRPDPFTGKEAKEMEEDIRRDMNRCEGRVDRLEILVNQINIGLANLPPDSLLQAVTRNSAEIRSLRDSVTPWVRLHRSPNDLMPPGHAK